MKVGAKNHTVTMKVNASFARGPKSLTVIVPRRFSLFWLLFIPLWFAGWITMAVTNPSGKPESILATAAFGVFTVLMVYEWLWNLNGKDELKFTTSELIHRQILFGLSRTRVYMMGRITDPHFVPLRTRGMTHTPSGLGFSYDGRQVRVCNQLRQKEANEIVAAMIQQIPELNERWGSYVGGILDYDSE
jgi:hypothetical protein